MLPNHRLHQEREQRGWSLNTIAEALGTTTETVKQWEQGAFVPPSFQDALCILFGLDYQSLGFQQEIYPDMVKSPDDGIAFLMLPINHIALPPPQAHKHRTAAGIYDPALPLPSTDKGGLVGRDALFQQLKERLIKNQSLALHGLPGIGKTALAVALAHDPEIRAQFHDGILWAGLGLHPNRLVVLNRWGTLLNLTTTVKQGHDHQEVLREALQSALENRRMLLVVDDAWQIEAVATLQVGGPQCAYLLTTRFAHIATHLAEKSSIQIPELEESDGVQLLSRFAPDVVQHERETALNLVRAVGGLPLALTLMSKYLGRYAYTRQPRRLHTALTHLHDTEQRLRLSMPRAPLENPSTLPASIGISIQSVLAVSDLHLPSEARQALRALSVLPAKPNSITQEAALAVAGVSLEVLNTLCDAGLLERYGSTRYMIHTVIADYARSQGNQPEAITRLIRYGIDFVEAHYTDVSALEQESAVILAALDCAWQMEWQEELIRGGILFAPFLLQHSWYSLAEQILSHAYTAATQVVDLQAKTQVLGYQSTLAHQQGDYAQAQTYAEEGLELAQRLDDQKQISRMLTRLGVVAQERGDYTQAEIYYQEGLARARQRGDKEQVSTLLKNLGVVEKKRGDYSQAAIYYREALELARQLGHQDLMSLLLMNLGVVANERGDYEQAEAYYQEALKLARQLGHRERICVLLSNLGVVADARGHYAQAEIILNEGLEIARQIGHRERISLLLLNLGVVASRQGKDAQTYYQEGLEIARQIGHRERISLFLLNLGEVAVEHKDFALAETCYQEGLALAHQLGHRERISDLQLHLGTLATKQEMFEQAEAHYQEGLKLARQIGNPQLICRLLASWGDLHLLQKRIEAAEDAFQEMLTLTPLGNQILVAHACYGLACVASARGDFDKARALAERSSTIFETLGHYRKNTVSAFLQALPDNSDS